MIHLKGKVAALTGAVVLLVGAGAGGYTVGHDGGPGKPDAYQTLVRFAYANNHFNFGTACHLFLSENPAGCPQAVTLNAGLGALMGAPPSTIRVLSDVPVKDTGTEKDYRVEYAGAKYTAIVKYVNVAPKGQKPEYEWRVADLR